MLDKSRANSYNIIIKGKQKEVMNMRNLVYKLADGSVVKTQAEAKASGQAFKAVCENIVEVFDTDRLTEKQIARRRRLA